MADEGFKGIPKADHDVLKKAAEMYTRVTGEPVKAIGQVPVLPEQTDDPEAKMKKAEEDLKAQAEATKNLEENKQKERQLRDRQAKGLGEKDEDKPEPILAPMAAAQGLKSDATPGGPKAKKAEPMNVKTSA